jgi:large subunit ribosomal protein L10
MAKTRDQKKEIIATLEKALKGAASSVFVHFRGVTVAEESRMRRAFRAEGLGYTVAKKTLMRIALTNLGYDHEGVAMDGEVAVAYNTTSTDSTLPANRIHAYGKELKGDKVTILGGIFDGKFLDALAMSAIATIPSLSALRGMFANIINSPRARFAIALSEVAKTKTS